MFNKIVTLSMKTNLEHSQLQTWPRHVVFQNMLLTTLNWLTEVGDLFCYYPGGSCTETSELDPGTDSTETAHRKE
jgi:hypothetical protein